MKLGDILNNQTSTLGYQDSFLKPLDDLMNKASYFLSEVNSILNKDTPLSYYDLEALCYVIKVTQDGSYVHSGVTGCNPFTVNLVMSYVRDAANEGKQPTLLGLLSYISQKDSKIADIIEGFCYYTDLGAKRTIYLNYLKIKDYPSFQFQVELLRTLIKSKTKILLDSLFTSAYYKSAICYHLGKNSICGEALSQKPVVISKPEYVSDTDIDLSFMEVLNSFDRDTYSGIQNLLTVFLNGWFNLQVLNLVGCSEIKFQFEQISFVLYIDGEAVTDADRIKEIYEIYFNNAELKSKVESEFKTVVISKLEKAEEFGIDCSKVRETLETCFYF